MKRVLITSFILLSSAYMFYSCVNNSAVRSFNQNVSKAPYDAIIVPGVPFEGESWQDVMKIRVYWSKYLYEQGYTKNIIYSGSAVYSPYVESIVMKQYGIALGIPPDHIYTETNAEHSTENLFYSYHMGKSLGFQKIALATDPFQSAMLKNFRKKHDIKVDLMPIVFDILKKIEKKDPEINPEPAYVKDFVALPDREGFFKRWRGTLGKNIDFNVEEVKQ